MIRTSFLCTFIEDVILNAKTATEGGSECLDFVPGSNFLGVIAKRYNEFQKDDKAYEVFHSGRVRFSDAHLFQNEERSLKVPASWYHEKGTSLDGSRIWVHGFISEDKIGEVQLKQARSGYFLPGSGHLIDPEFFFSLKSARDRSTRRAEEGQLFGYTSLRRGSEWCFNLECEDESLAERVKQLLTGVHHIGRSRTAQYGTAEVSEISSENIVSDASSVSGEVLLYAESRLALTDEFLLPTALPSTAALGLPNGSFIDKDKSQIRTYRYAPWNYKRKRRDADRICIEKGSVIAVRLSRPISSDHFQYGVGAYRAEGLGKVILNPSFLRADSNGLLAGLTLGRRDNVNAEKETVVRSDPRSHNAKLIEWIKREEVRRRTEEDILRNVSSFVKERGRLFGDSDSGITSSQWGQIRSMAAAASSIPELNALLFQVKKASSKDGKTRSYDRHESGFLVEGESAKVWSKRVSGKKLWEHLEEKLQTEEVKAFGPIYAVRLAAAMQADRRSREEKGGNNG